MAVYKPLVLDKNETDINKIMTKFYWYTKELKYTLSKLSLEDNMDKSVLDVMDRRDARVRVISFSADGLDIDLKDYGTGMHTSLEQTSDRISLLVEQGGVVDTMLTRMELYGEYITLRTGQVIIDAGNMTLNAAGDTRFWGAITGGSINIANRFIVDSGGSCYIDGNLTVATLNPPNGVYASELDVYNDNDVINTVTGNIACGEAYISEALTCRRVRQYSDRRLKTDIRELEEESAAKALQAIIPQRYEFAVSGHEAIGCVAQDIYRRQDADGMNLPVVGRHRGYLELPYNSYHAVYASAIQMNQKRIDNLKRDVWKLKGGKHVEL